MRRRKNKQRGPVRAKKVIYDGITFASGLEKYMHRALKKANIKNQIYYANRRQFISRATEIFGPTYAISTPRISRDVTFIITKT